MPDLFLVIKESFSLFVAFAVGIYAYTRLSGFYKLIFAQVVWYTLIYIGSYAITTYQDLNGIQRNNQWLYNLYIPTECLLLSLAGIVFFKNKKVSLRILTGYSIFLVTFIWQLSSMNFQGFANYGVVAEATLIVAIFLMILYSRFKDPSFNWRTAPEFWLCIGVATYFACIVPYFSMINVLNRSDMALNVFLFDLIVEVLSNVRYLFTAICFWLASRRHLMFVDTTI